jgi:AP-3 complex subunit delta-1
MLQHPRVVADHRDTVLQCLEDDDVTIRMRALDLVSAMASKRNLEYIVRKLLDHAKGTVGSYRALVVEKVLRICSAEQVGSATMT